MKRKSVVVAMAIILIISLIFNVQYYDLVKSNNRYTRVFLNNSSGCVYNIVTISNSIKESYLHNNFDQLDQDIHNLINDLTLLNQTINFGSAYIKNDLYYPLGLEFGRIAKAIDGTFKDESNTYQEGFEEDGIISENEYNFLVQLSDDLEDLIKPIYDDKKYELRKNANISDFNKALKIFIDKWDIIAERTPSGISPYDLLVVN